MADERAKQRLMGSLRAGARRFFTRARDVLTGDADGGGASSEAAAERAEAEVLAENAAELKGGLAKVAQMMGYLEGPGAAQDPDARAALGVLWDQAPGADPAAIRAIVEADLGQPIATAFTRWDDAPMAAASLGEVHGARTPDGVEVAVKVQYPGVAEGLRSDLASGSLVQRLAGNELGRALSEAALERLRDAVLGELDYTRERAMLDRFAGRLRGEPGMVIPKSFPALSGPRVLTAERLDGAPLLTWATSAAAEARAAVALTICRFAWGVPLVHGLFNADPNPGNYLVLDGAAGQVGFLDYGCAMALGDAVLKTERELWRALLHDQPDEFRHALVREGLVQRARVFDLGSYREWERYLTAPVRMERFAWTAAYARELTALTSELVRAGALVLGPEALLLWRQRLGVAAVLGSIGAEAGYAEVLRKDIRRAVAMMDDGPGGWT